MRALAVLLGFLLLGIALVALAPATLIDARIAAMTDATVRLADARGTAWSGAGTLADARGRWQVPLAWRLDPLALLRGEARVTFVPADDAAVRGEVMARDGGAALAGVHAVVPAAVAQAAWRASPVPQLDGTLVVDAPAVRLEGSRVEGSFDARWQRARIALSGIAVDLGEVEAHAHPVADALVLDLAGRGGDVTLAGTLRIGADALALDATLVPAATLAPALAALLRTLGPPAPGGGVRVTWTGSR